MDSDERQDIVDHIETLISYANCKTQESLDALDNVYIADNGIEGAENQVAVLGVFDPCQGIEIDNNEKPVGFCFADTTMPELAGKILKLKNVVIVSPDQYEYNNSTRTLRRKKK